MSAQWGKEKRDYYYIDYVDKDYPSKLSAKEEQAAAIEQEEALRIQKKLLSNLGDLDLQTVLEEDTQDNLIDFIENQNKTISSTVNSKSRELVNCDEDDYEDDDEEEDEQEEQGRQRRPINMAIQKNRGLTPYKKKEYRNPRVKHKLKYKKAMSKRRRNVREPQVEVHRYSGESAGIKTSTVRSIKLC